MKLAVMQPYLFPYIGYFQLIKSVDKIIMYDDVNYIKNGWIDRNRILVNGSSSYFKVPIKDASSNKKICETEINYSLYDNWKGKFYKTLEMSYKKAPLFISVMELVSEVFERRYEDLGKLATQSIVETSKYLDIKTEIVISSRQYQNANLQRTERLIHFCELEQASTYINLEAGRELYKKEDFKVKNVTLQFLKPQISVYHQTNKNFVPGLSILDVLMFNSKENSAKMQENFALS